MRGEDRSRDGEQLENKEIEGKDCIQCCDREIGQDKLGENGGC